MSYDIANTLSLLMQVIDQESDPEALENLEYALQRAKELARAKRRMVQMRDYISQHIQQSIRISVTDFGDQKIHVIKAIRKLTGLGLKEAKDHADNGTPFAVLPSVQFSDALAELRGLGAMVKFVP